MSELEDPSLLPTYPHEQRLEDESLDELRPILRGYFVPRDQRARDFGVDLTVEILLGERASDYSTMVQVKARSGLRINDDDDVVPRKELASVGARVSTRPLRRLRLAVAGARSGPKLIKLGKNLGTNTGGIGERHGPRRSCRRGGNFLRTNSHAAKLSLDRGYVVWRRISTGSEHL